MATMAYFYNIFIASPWQQWLILKIFVWLIQGDRVRQPPGDLAEKPGTVEHSVSETRLRFDQVQHLLRHIFARSSPTFVVWRLHPVRMSQETAVQILPDAHFDMNVFSSVLFVSFLILL